MKIRNGFVSNSSSASFIITIDVDLKEFIRHLCGYGFLNIDSIKAKLKDCYQYLGDFHLVRLKNIDKIIQDFENKEDPTDDDWFNYFQAALRLYWIELEFKDKMELSSGVTLFNEYDDIPKEFQTLISGLLLDGFQIKGHIEND